MVTADPLGDPRATDLLSAVPTELGALAADFRAVAGESAATSTGLSAAQHDGVWTGAAADAFHAAIGRLPAQLDTMRAGYDAVAQALAVYEPELERVKTAFVALVGQLQDAQSRVQTAQAAAQEATTRFGTLTRADGVPSAALGSAELAVAQTGGSVRAYAAEIADLNTRALALLDEFATARDACKSAVAAAQADAVRRPAGTGPGTGGTGTTSVSLTSFHTVQHPVGP